MIYIALFKCILMCIKHKQCATADCATANLGLKKQVQLCCCSSPQLELEFSHMHICTIVPVT